MQERPNIQEQQIGQTLYQNYGLNATELTFLPIGADSSASVYSAETKGSEKYFLKLKRGKINPSAYLVPRLLKDNNIPQIVAPLLSQAGTLWCDIPDSDYSLIVYPFIEARTAYEAKLTSEQWRELGAILGQIHATPFVIEALPGIRQETFQLHPRWGPIIRRIDRLVDENNLVGPYQKELALFWQAKRLEINQLVARTVELGQRCLQREQRRVLCHADFHIFNVLVDDSDMLYVVDWDEAILAPIERDLMFIIGQSAGLITIENEEQSAFLEGYSQAGSRFIADDIDPVTMSYYRYEWVVQEIGDYGERVFFDDEFGDETKADSVKEFKGLFESGDVVEGAYRSDVQ